MNDQRTSGLPETLKLDNQLCFSLYAASRAITRAYRPILERYSLTYPQYLVLLALWEQDRLTINEIGKKLYLDSGTLTPLLKRMEYAGYICRRRDSKDERRVEIHLDDRGLSLKKQAFTIPLNLLKTTHLNLEELHQTKMIVDQILCKLMLSGAINTD